MFFAPAQVKKRHAEWGAQGLNERLVSAWAQFCQAACSPAAPWLVVERHMGPVAAQAVFLELLAGHADPRTGHIASLQPA